MLSTPYLGPSLTSDSSLSSAGRQTGSCLAPQSPQSRQLLLHQDISIQLILKPFLLQPSNFQGQKHPQDAATSICHTHFHGLHTVINLNFCMARTQTDELALSLIQSFLEAVTISTQIFVPRQHWAPIRPLLLFRRFRWLLSLNLGKGTER